MRIPSLLSFGVIHGSVSDVFPDWNMLLDMLFCSQVVKESRSKFSYLQANLDMNYEKQLRGIN